MELVSGIIKSLEFVTFLHIYSNVFNNAHHLIIVECLLYQLVGMHIGLVFVISFKEKPDSLMPHAYRTSFNYLFLIHQTVFCICSKMNDNFS